MQYMQEDDLMQVVLQTGAIVEEMGRQAKQSIQHSQQATQTISQTANTIPNIVNQSIDKRMGDVTRELVSHVKQGIQTPIEIFANDVKTAKDPVFELIRRMEGQVVKLEKLNKFIMSKVLVVVGATMLLGVFGGAWLASYYRDIIIENKMNAEWVQLLNRADLIACEDQLCSKPDKGKKSINGYVVVAPK
jgi:hypothetical protein